METDERKQASDGIDITGLDANGIKYVGNLQRLQLQPGDVFVVTFEMILSQEHRKDVERILEKILPGQKVIVLDRNAKIGVFGLGG